MKNKIYSTLTNIRIYKKNSIFFKYMKSLLIMFLVPLLLFVSIISNLYITNINKNTERSVMKQTLVTKLTFENLFGEIEGIQNILRTNIDTQAFILTPPSKLNSENTKNQIKKIQETITNQMRISNTVSDIYIYSFYSDTVLTHNYVAPIGNLSDVPWYDRYNSTNKSYDLFTSYSSDGYNLFYTTPLSFGSKNDALIIIKVNILNIFDIMKYDSADTMYLLDSENNVLISNSLEKINKPYDLNLLKNFDREASEIYININNAVPVSAFKLSFPGSALIMEFSSVADNTTESVVVNIILFIILTIILSIVVSFMLSMDFYGNITQIIQNTNLTHDSSSFAQIDNELEYITQNIMAKTSKIQRMEDELAEKMLLLKRSQIVALQTQINPHFILNVLNLVNVSLLSDGFVHHDAIHINSILSDIIHNILNINEYIVTIRQEIEYTKKYIEIASIKTKNKFITQWDINSEYFDLKILKFILQPIIENSIEHGFKQSKKECNTLKISLRVTDDRIIFTVDDDGCGMDSATLTELTQKSKTYDIPNKAHIGFLNVHQRIKILYGDVYGCKILKSNETGTIVEIVLPNKQ